ncbi:MAG: ComEC/Rec2 family competence protein [Acidimicrobiales bacterium]
MSDLASVVMALTAAIGAWSGHPLPLLPAAALVALGLARRQPFLLVLGVGLAASGLSARSEAGLHPPVVGPFAGVATLVTDPAEVNGAVRVDLRFGGKRVEAWARGVGAGRLSARSAGEQIAVKGTVRRVPPEARRWLDARHVAGRMTVDDVGAWGWGSPASRVANSVRRTLAVGAESMSPERRALFSGFVLGDDRDQPPEVKDDFRAAGLTHLLAVSGQNVAFVLALFVPVLRRLGLGGRLMAGVGLLLLFGLVTRWEPSVLRAVAMAALAMLAATLGRPVASIRILALAVTGLLLVDPMLVRSVGFALSVGACAGIALLAEPIAARLPGPRSIAAVVGVTLAAQVGVAPVLVPVFGGLPVASVPANLLAVPMAGPLMMWGLGAGLVAGLAGDPLARLAHLPTGMAVAWEAGVARWGAALPLGQLGRWHLGALGGLVVVGMVARRRRNRQSDRERPGRPCQARLGTAVLTVGALAVVLAPAVQLAEGAPLDGRPVSAGARLWREGAATVLVVDGGLTTPATLLSGLRAAGVRRLDVVVATRASRAVATSLGPVLRRFPARLVLAPSGDDLTGAVVPLPGSLTRVGRLSVETGQVQPRLEVRVIADH